jgi:hypothetical protein
VCTDFYAPSALDRFFLFGPGAPLRSTLGFIPITPSALPPFSES